MKLFFTGITCLIIICLYSLPVRAEMSGGVSDDKTPIRGCPISCPKLPFCKYAVGIIQNENICPFSALFSISTGVYHPEAGRKQDGPHTLHTVQNKER